MFCLSQSYAIQTYYAGGSCSFSFEGSSWTQMAGTNNIIKEANLTITLLADSGIETYRRIIYELLDMQWNYSYTPGNSFRDLR